MLIDFFFYANLLYRVADNVSKIVKNLKSAGAFVQIVPMDCQYLCVGY